MASDLNKPGGTKKFLYSGPVKRHGPAQFDDDVDDREWNFEAHINSTTNKLQHESDHASSEFDIDSVWSVKKNINVPNLPTAKKAPISQGLDVNMGKGYYSRHTTSTASGDVLSGPVGNGQQTSTEFGGKSWNQPQARNFSYSYASKDMANNKRQELPGSEDMLTETSRNQPQHASNPGSTFRIGGVSQGGRVQNTNRYSRPF